MNILFITNLYPPHYVGGFEIRCAQTAEALVSAGHRVTILTSSHGFSAPIVERDGPAEVHRSLQLYLPFTSEDGTVPFELDRWQRWKVTQRNCRKTREFASRLRPDVVFMWSQARLSIGPARAVQKLGLPCVWTFGDPNIAQYRPISRRRGHLAAYLLDRLLLRSATWSGVEFDHAHILSIDLEKRLALTGLAPRHPRVIYRGIPVECFPLRADVGVAHQPARLLFVGQLHPWKGVHTLIEAVRLLTKKHGSQFVSLTLAGDGEPQYVTGLKRTAAGCPAIIDFLGRIAHQELPAIYQSHDIFVFPSAGGGYEGFGVTHLEAMASGLPVIGTLEGGQAELFEDRRNCLVFRTEDAKDLSDKIEHLIAHPDLRESLAVYARAQVEQHHTMDAFMKALEEMLFDACQEHLRS